MSLISRLFESIARMPGTFADVAMHDPAAAAMLFVGTVLMVLSIGVVALLTLGALLELFTPSTSSPPQQPAR